MLAVTPNSGSQIGVVLLSAAKSTWVIFGDAHPITRASTESLSQ